MANRGTPRWVPYAAAAVLTAATVALRLAISPWVGDRPLLILFFIPLMISAWWGGLGPGLFATALTALVTDLYLFPPLGSLWFERPLDLAQWLFLLLEGALVSVLFGVLGTPRLAERYRLSDPRRVSTERKVFLGFSIALAFLGAIGVVSYLSVVRLTDTSALVTRSHVVMSSIDALVATSWEAESAQRGYIISGEEPFAAQYTRAAGRVEGLVQQLRDTVRQVPAQLARADALASAVRERIAQSTSILEVRRSGGLEAVQRRLAQSAATPGSSMQARIHELAQEMKTAEIRLLNEREDDARDSARVTQSVIVGGSALAVLCLGLALVAIRRDIAGRERAEAELNQFFDASVDLFVISSGDGYFKRVSSAVTDMLGYSVEEVLRIPYLELIHPDDRLAARAAVDRQLLRGERVDQFLNRYRHKDGSYRTLSWRSIPRANLMFASARDVTDAVRAEQELREAKEQLETRVAERTRELQESIEATRRSERRFRALIEHGSDSIALTDLSRKILYMSPAVMNVEGYTPEELIGKDAAEQTHPDDIPILQRRVAALLENPGEPISAIWRRRHRDGHWIWLEGVATNMLDDPSVGAIVTNYRDITERLAHEARLGEQLKRLALLSRITQAIGERQDLRSIFSVVAAHIEDELPVDFCVACLIEPGEDSLTVTCVGARSEPAAQQLDMMPGSTVPIDENGLARCMHGQFVYEPVISEMPFPFPRRLASAGLGAMVIAPLLVESQVFGALVCARRAPDSFSSADCEFLRQVSEHTALAAHQVRLYDALQQAYDDLRQTQQQFLQQERLRALGQMASGIAHDINNAISPVALYTEQLLEREPNLSPRARGQLEIIQRAVDDVAQTVARMGEFYRTREPPIALVAVDLNRVVQQVIDLTRARWSDMAQQRGIVIDVRLSLSAGLPAIAAVDSQVRDALVNLVFNAVDAMPEGGPLTIATRLAASGSTVQLEVEDRGIGMDDETRRRCLEPFFTTKGARGTGMGLAMVYGVVQRHGATIEIESVTGRGTRVRLGFNVATSKPALPSGSQRAPVGPQRILIIDDDPMLLKSLREALESDGHLVAIANGGQAGIDAFVESHADGQPYPVVITDLGMPRVDGRTVAATVKSSVPGTLVILLTGWGRRLVSDDDRPPGVDLVMPKPAKLTEIRAALANFFSRQ
ncbi:MAG TPA: PAS domain S-box protein [Steroidobacteraceae bacterium]|nr:PAS domain S-box protein [Steroidobacteraceae bacterium]